MGTSFVFLVVTCCGAPFPWNQESPPVILHMLLHLEIQYLPSLRLVLHLIDTFSTSIRGTRHVPSKTERVTDECKTHLCFEFISHAILCILYPYSCKTHKISSKLGFVGLLMKSK